MGKSVYRLIRVLLFYLNPEVAHRLAIRLLPYWMPVWRAKRRVRKHAPHVRSVFGLSFPSPVGLAAGFDKDAECVDALLGMGFGFVEVGTVTPLPQPGNPKPRLFRLKKHNAIINRMGFNNAGVDALVARLKRRKVPGIVGVNIGKNKDTPLTRAIDDYQLCLEKVVEVADYVVVNLSSPNTPGLRSLQGEAYLESLLSQLCQTRDGLAARYNKRVPLLVKVSPDLSQQEMLAMAKTFLNVAIDGVIATNTSVSRVGVCEEKAASEAGGLSGAPIATLSEKTLACLYQALGDKIPLISAGGVMSSADVQRRLGAGASLVQVYTGWIMNGVLL